MTCQLMRDKTQSPRLKSEGEMLKTGSSYYSTLNEHSGNEPAVKIKKQVPKINRAIRNLPVIPETNSFMWGMSVKEFLYIMDEIGNKG